MFLEYYNLLEQPFGVTPDTRFLYLNHMYRETLASLWYGIKGGSRVHGSDGRTGDGKDDSVVSIAATPPHDLGRTVFLFQTCCDSSDLIRYLLQDLGICPASDVASMHYQLNEVLLREAGQEGNSCL